MSSKKRQENDPQISVILSDALETMKACGLLISKIELESALSTVRIDSQAWRQLGSDRIYYKIDDILRKLRINNNIGTLTHVLGGNIFYMIVNRAEYTSFIGKQMEKLIGSISTIISPDISPGIRIMRDILDRIDPSFNTLSKWIKGNNSRDFERGISVLLSLSGFRTIQTGEDYETASLQARRTKYRLGKSNLDIIALSMDEKHFLLCQCTIDTIENKIGDLMNITNEVRENIGGNLVKLHPVIITSVSKKQITSSLDNANNNGIAVFTLEDLEEMLKSIEDSKSLGIRILNKLSEINSS